ncbi:hypothetical protein GJAV_G00146140 [Gymnothorax javanicus]|nr:hypothetical protein GJAV_G00146140 [Gymnothorax javanicus]
MQIPEPDEGLQPLNNLRAPHLAMPGWDHSELFADFQRQFLPPMFGVEFCLAVVGNSAALWLMATRARRRSSQRIWHTGLVFSCNLAASDLMYVLTLPLLMLYYAGGKHWRFSSATCTVERFLFTCNLYSSILFIACISVNRYVGIVHPFFTRSHVRPKHAWAISLLVWVTVVAGSTPVLRFARACPKPNGTTVECVSSCGKADEGPHFAYSVTLAVFGCLLPFLATVASYASIFREVWRNGNITRVEKRKVGLMVGAVLALYAISFVPYHVLRNYHLHLKLIDGNQPQVYKAYQVSKGLVTLNMCLHPLLYMSLFGSIQNLCCGGSEEEEGAVA